MIVSVASTKKPGTRLIHCSELEITYQHNGNIITIKGMEEPEALDRALAEYFPTKTERIEVISGMITAIQRARSQMNRKSKPKRRKTLKR